ncbi:MAG: IclR family transcriptional regulator [Actinobacteria bacterium]|nr:IclR family transcriptional regulator [Actinomycetota bacterium]
MARSSAKPATSITATSITAATHGASPTGAQAIDRAGALLVSILDSGTASDRPPHVATLARTHDLPKSTTSRLLSALERQGLIQRDRDGAFHPGPVITRYARSGQGESALATELRPILQHLALESGETVNLAIAGAQYVDLIDQIDGRYLLGARNWVGTPVPYHASALGKIFMAFGVTEIPVGRLEKRTPLTITSHESLSAELAQVRTRGFATIVDELEEGLTAIALPLFDGAHRVIAAISVSGPTSRLSGGTVNEIVKMMIKAIGQPGEAGAA